MLKIQMFSSATKVKGQGVGSAYTELIDLLRKKLSGKLEISINKFSRSDISHYHTIDPLFFLTTFFPGRGRKIGYVHFLPETLEGSLKLPWLIKKIVYRYVIAFYRRMDQLVVVNPIFIKDLEKYGIAKEKITYIPNFVSRDVFFPQGTEDKRSIRASLGINQNKFVVLGVGQVQERKGVPDFIELAKKLPEVQFIWVGGFSFGKITDGYEELKRVVDNPPENLIFPGIVDREKMNDYYNIADVFLLPSYNELFPMSILEAFSTGTPVVLRSLELYEVILKGYYLDAKDVSEFELVLRNLANTPELVSKMSRKSLDASNYYSEDNLAKIWYDFYYQQTEMVK
ncbi:glycosyltransferase family 4 protein [Liquorilactobacillus hordei]|uniref:Glycosyltransferase n=1 Tax=Liquorilactobacillus hordei DSM 19519 TaxID=1423759 RepID=A0A0R1ML35_9LACO|nr:glycosyltransferase family 4 protein [Liquorilactobacillus hordei]KRL05299.1 glycosyltransferase [Liquorilactobacillus hordei DSM 19519]QYH52866.1 glycosyltransferase family 4 protein [Liquorilactobacillus hordei DSM 19519]